MPEHQQTQQSKKPDTIFQKQTTSTKQIPISNPMAIIQRAKINPKSLTHADVMQLQRTIGNRAVGRLLSEIGLIPSTAKLVQRQEIAEEEKACPSCVQRQEIPEEEEPLQVKMMETVQRQEIPEEEEPLQGKMAETVQRQEISEKEEPLQGKMIETVQRQEIPEEEEPLQGKFENKPEMTCPSSFAAPIVQRQEIPEEEELIQGKMTEPVQRQEIPEEEEPLQTKRENNTGMPDNLKAGVESLSGIDMSDVRVHYNSDKPKDVGALAYTQGNGIHVAPGQERHLPHEAWHVVQQAQGRVRPTVQLKDGVQVNDDEGLEKEADVMGENAIHRQTQVQRKKNNRGEVSNTSSQDMNIGKQDITIIDNKVKLIGQRKIKSLNDGSKKIIQRHIHWVNPPGQFQIDVNRPPWMDGMGAIPLLPGQSRNHIVDFENIQNDLAIILNALVAANTLANQQHLIDLTDALMPTPGAPRANMVAFRIALINSITAGTVANYHNEARALLSRLNSSPDNVRAGNAATNLSIGQNIDADFNPGTVAWPGGMAKTAAAPAGAMIPAQNVLTLIPVSNNQVYRYQEATTQMLSFVINPLNNRQLSSVTGPTVGHAPPYPVLVTDPAGAALPFIYM